jgi:hypothetical protein
MGIADAVVTPQSAAPATKLIVRAFTGTSLIVARCHQKQTARYYRNCARRRTARSPPTCPTSKFTGPYARLLSIWIDVPAANRTARRSDFRTRCVSLWQIDTIGLQLAFGITWGLRDPCALAWLTTKW